VPYFLTHWLDSMVVELKGVRKKIFIYDTFSFNVFTESYLDFVEQQLMAAPNPFRSLWLEHFSLTDSVYNDRT
jgi:hypothetical protein